MSLRTLTKKNNFGLLFMVVALLILHGTAHADDNDDDDEAFSMSLADILDIEIESASLRPESISDAPATAVVITARDIEERGYEFFGDLLRDIPGVDLVNVNGTYRTVFSQRGTFTGENNRSLIIIDGIVESNILEGSVLHGGQYSLHNVQQVEVIYGPASALYGANAFGGIISITTKSPQKEESIAVNLGGGTDGSEYQKLLVNKKFNEQSAIHFSAHLYNTDGTRFEGRPTDYSNSYVEDAYSVETRLMYDNYLLGISLYDRPSGLGTFSDVAGFEAVDPALSDEPGLLQSDFDGEKPTLWHMVTSSFFGKASFDISETMKASGKIFYRESKIDLDSYSYNFTPPNAENPNGIITRNSFGHVSDTMGVEGRLDWFFDDNSDFIVGVQLEESDIERGYRTKFPAVSAISQEGVPFFVVGQAGESQRISDDYRNYAIFSQYRNKLGFIDNTKIIIGARYDYNNQYGTDFGYGETFNPRIGLIHELMPKVKLKFLYGTAFRAPTSFDRFTETETRRANPGLSPEKMETTEFGFNIDSLEHVAIHGNIFYNEISNSIISNVDTGEPNPDNPGTNFTQNQNAGGGRFYGMELRLNGVYKNIQWFFNTTYQDAWQKDQNDVKNDWPNIAELKANLGFTIRMADDISIYLVENWVGDRSTSLTSTIDEVQGYSLTNLSVLNKNFLISNLDLSISVDNLFDEEWFDPGIRVADDGFYATRHPQAGSEAMLELTYTWQ